MPGTVGSVVRNECRNALEVQGWQAGEGPRGGGGEPEWGAELCTSWPHRDKVTRGTLVEVPHPHCTEAEPATPGAVLIPTCPGQTLRCQAQPGARLPLGKHHTFWSRSVSAPLPPPKQGTQASPARSRSSVLGNAPLLCLPWSLASLLGSGKSFCLCQLVSQSLPTRSLCGMHPSLCGPQSLGL